MRTYKKVITFLTLFLLTILFLCGCNKNEQVEQEPKYIFLFIGDGMGYPQMQLTSDYLGAVKDSENVGIEALSFMKFPVSGTVSNYDKTSYIPDSASSGSGIATGQKIRTGTVSHDGEKPLETIAEKLKHQKNWKIGMVSSTNINHTTPADFFAHQECRTLEYEIGLDLIESEFDYFGSGGFRQATGKEEKQVSLYDLAEQKGYQILQTNQEIQKYQNSDNQVTKSKVIAIPENLDSQHALAYTIDQTEGMTLADLVEKGIELLNNSDGFFMMVEGGKIDWACHQNDTATCIQEVIAFNQAVEKAVDFYNKYPEETLLVVTADHETGGLTLGNTETGYRLYPEQFQNQTISYETFQSKYLDSYKKEQTEFETVLQDVEENFGLSADRTKAMEHGVNMQLSQYDISCLKEAYEATLQYGSRKENEMTEEEYLRYGTGEPFTIEILHILARKSGVGWSTFVHTGLCVPVFACGKGQETFVGYYDNTELFQKICTLTNVT